MTTRADRPYRPVPPPAPARFARPRLTIVGPCAAGKSTLAAGLTAAGHAVRICGQEHTDIPHLWTLGQPDLLIYLSVSLAGVRRRRQNPRWPAAIYQRQQRRLQHALRHCDLYIDTDARGPAAVLALVRAGIEAAWPSRKNAEVHGVS